MDRHGAVAAVLAAGTLLQAAVLAIPSRPARAIAESKRDWAAASAAGKPIVVPARSATAAVPLDPVRGLLFFQTMKLQTVSESDLSSLPGISDTIAGRIVDLRGLMKRPLNWTDVDNINGVGEKTLLTIQEYVTIE